MNRLMGVLDKLLLSLSQWFTKSGLSPRSHSIFVALFSTGISWFDQFYHSITEVPDYFLMLVFVSLTNTLANVYASTATHSSIGEHCSWWHGWLPSLCCHSHGLAPLADHPVATLSRPTRTILHHQPATLCTAPASPGIPTITLSSQKGLSTSLSSQSTCMNISYSTADGVAPGSPFPSDDKHSSIEPRGPSKAAPQLPAGEGSPHSLSTFSLPPQLLRPTSLERHIPCVFTVITYQQKRLQLPNLQQQKFPGFQIEDYRLVHKSEFTSKKVFGMIAFTGTKEAHPAVAFSTSISHCFHFLCTTLSSLEGE